MAKKIFETVLKWNGGGTFWAKVEVDVDGWGRVYDGSDGLYCGLLNPLRTRQLMRVADLEQVYFEEVLGNE